MFRLALHWQILIAVILAASCGLILNATVSTRQGDYQLPKGRYATIRDSTNRITITTYKEEPETFRKKLRQTVTGMVGLSATPLGSANLSAATQLNPETSPEFQHWTVDPTGKTRGAPTTLSLLEKKDKKAVALFNKYGKSRARSIGDFSYYAGSLFLRLLKMVSIPLIITSLMSGVLGLADAGRLRKLFSYTILYYISTSILAIFTGLFLVNTIQPGNRGEQPKEVQNEEVSGDLGEVLTQQIETMIPTNPIESVADSEFLSIIAFTLAFGIFTILVGGHPLKVFRELFESGFKVMMAMTMAIIHLAPIGVFFLMLYATATQGVEVFQALGWYMLTVFSALVFHAVVVLPAIVHFVGRRNPFRFAHAMSPALLTAFSSASSNATLPLTLSCVENRAGIDNRVGSFVLPLGATINMDGTALFEVIAVLFIAQLEPTVNLGLGEQIIIAFTALSASIGAAGIPHAGLVMMVIVLQAVGLPADRVGLILAVDRILDMCRTSVNVWSDSCGCAVIARLDRGDIAESITETSQTEGSLVGASQGVSIGQAAKSPVEEST